MMRLPLFRIWYSTTYTALLVLTLLLLCVSPGDTLYQSIRTREIQKLFVIGGVYLLTCLVVVLIYSTRVYTNRTVLAAIPTGYLPIEAGEVGKGVRRMVVKHLTRAAVVAWDSRPRDTRGEAAPPGPGDAPETTMLPIDPHCPPWGHVAHPGWASPSSPDLPSLHYWAVLCELPNLIEAKAVSLAPPDPTIDHHPPPHPANGPPLPDAHIVTLLQRPRAMGLRDYLARLASFRLLHPPSLGPAFLAQYEAARFSCHCLTEPDFRALMAVFADIVNGMSELDLSVVQDVRAHSITSDSKSLAPTESSSDTRSSSESHEPYRTPQLHRQRPVSSYSNDDDDDRSSSATGSLSSAGGRRTPSQHSTTTLRTAPSTSSWQRRDSSPVYGTPRSLTPSGPSELSLRRASATSLSLETESDTGSVMIHSMHLSPSTLLSSSSLDSLESSARSVIRLHPRPSLGGLPYQYRHQIDGG